MNEISQKTAWKILNFLRRTNPQTWWREYQPKALYDNQPANFDKSAVRRYLAAVFSPQNPEPVGVYVHLPFCRARCSFCKFYSVGIRPGGESLVWRYLEALEKEAALFGINFRKKKVDNIYIGGGTPTLLNRRQWGKLMEICQKYFSFEKHIQIASEGTPESINYQKAKLLRDLGVNRMTLGVQSFDDGILKSAGRLHTSRDVYRAFFDLQKAGFKNINFDIIYGFPGENQKSYFKTLKGIAELRPARVSIYPLDIGSSVSLYETGKISTPHFKNIKSSHTRSRFGLVFKKNGYEMDEQGNYGFFMREAGREETANRNLLLKWQFHPVLGLGCAAESHLKAEIRGGMRTLRYVKLPALENYLAGLRKKRWPPFGGREFSEDETLRRYVIYRLFYWRGSLNKRDFFANFKKDVKDVFKTEFSSLLKSGLIFETEDDWKIANFDSDWPVSRKEHSFSTILKYFYAPEVVRQCIDLINNNGKMK